MRSAPDGIRDAFAVGGLLLVLALLFIFNAGWEVMTPAGQIDPYIYTGYMRDLGELRQGLYQGSRLPWLLYGHVPYSLFDPSTANLVLRVSLWLTATIAMYFTVKRMWGKTIPAFGAAALMGLHPYFLDAIRWDYVDAPSLALTPLVFMLITHARGARLWQLHIFAAGFFTMCLLSLNLSLVSFLPTFALLGLTVGPEGGRRIALSVPLAFAGAAVCFVFFGLINRELVGPFNYLELQIRAAREIDPDIYHPKSWKWLETAWWLTLPAGLLLATAVTVAGLRRRTPLPTLVAIGIFWFVCAGWAGFQLRGATISTPWYVSFLIPFSFLAVGALLAVGNRVLTVVTVVFIVSLGVGLNAIDDPVYFDLVYELDDAVWQHAENGRLYYWYNLSEPPGYIYNGASSLRGWYARLLSQDFPSLANPVLPGVINEPPPGVPIAIITDSADAQLKADATLAPKGLRTELVAKGTVRGIIGYTIVRVEPEGSLVPLDLSKLFVTVPGSSRPGRILTGPTAYGGGAYLPLPPVESKDGYIRVRLTVRKGPVDICVLTRDGTACLAQQEVSRAGSADVVLKVPSFAQAGFVVIRSGSVAVNGEVSVEAISLILPDQLATPP